MPFYYNVFKKIAANKKKYDLTFVPINWLIYLAPCLLLQVAISFFEILDTDFKAAKVVHKSIWYS
nr:hypothetical protein [Zobellia laminariae]